jgi:hypothetical protein
LVLALGEKTEATPEHSLLIRVREDAEHHLHRREGRLSCPRDQLRYPHLMAAWRQEMGRRFIANIAKLGYEWDGSKLGFRGPFEHLEFSDDTAPDPGYLRCPDPRDVRRRLEIERQERERTARAVQRGTDLVDFTVVGSFRRKALPLYRVR